MKTSPYVRPLGLLLALLSIPLFTLGLLLSLLSISLFSPHVEARQNFPDGSQARKGERTEQTPASTSPIAPLRASRREDLDQLLGVAEEKNPAGHIDFYQMQSPPGPPLDYDATWIVAVARSTGEVYKLNGFEAPLPGGGQEFNRLTSHLGLSISTNNEAISLARLFMACCAGGERSETVVNEDGLRLTVQDYYYETYGDVWRMLDAYAEWWQTFKVNAPDLQPKIGLENGRYSVVLKKVLMVAGRTPQLQDCNLQISRDGYVRLLAVEPVFPKRVGWVFYNSTKPSFCDKTERCDNLPGGWYGFAAKADDPVRRSAGVLDMSFPRRPSGNTSSANFLRALMSLFATRTTTDSKASDRIAAESAIAADAPKDEHLIPAFAGRAKPPL